MIKMFDDYKGFIDIDKVLKDEYNYTFNGDLKELYSVLYVNEDNYLWSTYDDNEFMPFRKLSDDFKNNDYVVEMVIAYTSSYKIKEAIPEIDDMNVENKVKTLKNIGLNSNGYHIK